MNRRNKNVKSEYSRDRPANSSGHSRRMERASNWRLMKSRTRNYNTGNEDDTSRFSEREPSRPNTVNRSRNGPSNGNRSTKPSPKRTAPVRSNRSPPRAGPNSNKSMLRGIEPPSLGEPGGLDDPLRKGLSGAGTKWYWRYLAEGWKPEVARQKAEEHRQGAPKTTGPPIPKRVRSTYTANLSGSINKAKPRNHRKISGKSLKMTNKSTPIRPIYAAVLPSEYPRTKLKPEELVQLEEAIIDEVTLGHDKKITFKGVKHRTNMLIIECKDWDTYGWLKAKIPTLSGWKGATLKAIMEYKVPKAYNISVFLPRSSGKTHEQLLALIKAQNEGLRTDRWIIKSSTEENDGQTVIIAIDGYSNKVISKNGNTLCYRYGTIPVKVEETEPSVEPSVNEGDKNMPVDADDDEVDGGEVDERVELTENEEEVDESLVTKDEEEADVEMNAEDE